MIYKLYVDTNPHMLQHTPVPDSSIFHWFFGENSDVGIKCMDCGSPLFKIRIAILL